MKSKQVVFSQFQNRKRGEFAFGLTSNNDAPSEADRSLNDMTPHTSIEKFYDVPNESQGASSGNWKRNSTSFISDIHHSMTTRNITDIRRQIQTKSMCSVAVNSVMFAPPEELPFR